MNSLQSEQGIQVSRLDNLKIQQQNKQNKIKYILILVFVFIVGMVLGSFISKNPSTNINTNQKPSTTKSQNPSINKNQNPNTIASTSDCAPDPYKTVHLMPYAPYGFYGNAQQVEKLIKQYNVATIIEVGTYMGLSALHMASLIPENGKVYAVDTFQGQPTQVFKYDSKILQTLYDQFLSNVIHKNMTHKVVPVKMTSEQAARKLNVYPHMIYIDATHTYDEAKKDLKLWYPFVKDHGIICGDDYIWMGSDGVGRAVEQFAKQNGLKTYNNGLFWKMYKE